jgi:hypothetical protein
MAISRVPNIQNVQRSISLPKPDEFGNYWFGRRNDNDCPAIFKIDCSKHGHYGEYMLSLGKDGVVFEKDGSIKAFQHPENALYVLQLRAGQCG